MDSESAKCASGFRRTNRSLSLTVIQIFRPARDPELRPRDLNEYIMAKSLTEVGSVLKSPSAVNFGSPSIHGQPAN